MCVLVGSEIDHASGRDPLAIFVPDFLAMLVEVLFWLVRHQLPSMCYDCFLLLRQAEATGKGLVRNLDVLPAVLGWELGAALVLNLVLPNSLLVSQGGFRFGKSSGCTVLPIKGVDIVVIDVLILHELVDSQSGLEFSVIDLPS